jgi:hypothetical protein
VTTYADPARHKYPLDTDSEIRAAWSYIHMPKNQAMYSRAEVAQIMARIEAAWKKRIDPKGPHAASAHAQRSDKGRQRWPFHTGARGPL